MKLLLLFLTFVLASEQKPITKPVSYDPNYTAVAKLYSAFVVVEKGHSRVSYAEIKKNPALLKAATQSLSDISETVYSRMTFDEKTAFYINAFNVHLIQWVVDHYPIKTAPNPKAWFGNAFKDKFFSLLGKPQSLDGIRNDILRFQFKNTQILFTLCEGSVDGPDLNPKPYLGSHIRRMLEEAEKKFMGDPSRAIYDSTAKRFKISKYLKRYNKDFEESFMLLKNYLALKLAKHPSEQMDMKDPRIVTEFFEWNDQLNDKF